MKTSEVRPETFIQGLGQYSYDGMMQGLGVLGMSSDEMLLGLSGLGSLGQSAVDAIVANYSEMKAKQQKLATMRAKAADANPQAAYALKQAVAKTAAPGTNEARGIMQTMRLAAQRAFTAKKDEAIAKKLVAQNDPRAAAAKAVTAMTAAREAMTLANRAEKTRLARSLDMTINTLQAQASYIDQQARQEVARSGSSARSTALSATAQNLRQEADKLKKYSAVVAAQPDVPPGAPSQQRIADVANKFNIRTASRAKFMQKQALLSVLGDLTDDPLAQVKDYDGALAYYGNDSIGRLMADIEFDNRAGFLQGLHGHVHGIGQIAMPLYAQAQRAINQGQALARKTYAATVVPVAAGLGGLGWDVFAAAGANESKEWNENWCRTNVPSGKTDSAKLYNGDVDKCLKDAPLAPPPWSCAGLGFRGVLDAGGVATCLIKGVGAWITSGQAGKDIDKALQTAGGVTGGNKPPPAAQPPAAQPPPATQPARVDLDATSLARQRQALVGKGGGVSVPSVPQPSAGMSTGVKVAIGGGILAVAGVGAYLAFGRR